MGKSRPRFNEKARASSRKPNQRPHPKARDGGLGKETFEASVQQTKSVDKLNER
jgi:ATP-dependent RNA helicase DHX37/DHR1